MFNFQAQFVFDDFKRRQLEQAQTNKSHASVIRQYIREAQATHQRQKRR